MLLSLLLLSLLLLLLLLLSRSIRMFSVSSSCKMTAACMMAMMMMMMMMMSEVTAMPKGAKHHHPREHKDSSLETVPLQLDSNTMVPSKIIRPLENSSISPWTYKVSHDPSLHPAMLSEAVCVYRGCLDKEGLVDESLESKPIMHQVMLLRRVRSPGETNYHYRLESRLIAVGCTCVRPIVQYQ
ncbi:interleukin 17a/f1 [Scomber japonicus]|uniref:interleukin 17a/f1 n=1 Tax=Scomber japonicus TaxID=13676 RepID=UPI002305515F|nr:interleukin 17a/f1 [Scomber japonicus]